MVKVDLPYLWAAKGRSALYWFYRRDGQRIPITGERGERLSPDDDGFLAAYERVHLTFQTGGRTAPGIGSLQHAITVYKASPKFAKKAPRTKRDYCKHLDALAVQYGHCLLRPMMPENVANVRDELAATPRTGNYRIAVLSVVLSFAALRPRTFGLPQGWRNPAAGWERLEMDGPGYRQWPDNLIHDIRDRVSTELQWLLDMALFSGQRGGDCIKMLWSHYDGDVIEVVQAKTGKRLDIPAHPTLRATLAEIPRRHALILTNERERPWGASNYQHKIQIAVEACGLKGYSLHGLRRNAVTRMLEAGCSPSEVSAVTGQSLAMVEKYAIDINQRKLARSAIAKLPRLERWENGK